MPNIFLPEHFKVVSATAGCRTTNGGITLDNIKLSDAITVWLVAHFRQAASHATTIQLGGAATDTSVTSITFSAEWWKNADISSSDTLTAQTAATSQACTAGTTDQLIVIKIDPSDVVAQNATYDWLGGTVSDSSQATNFCSAVWYIQTRYPQATPDSAIA